MFQPEYYEGKKKKLETKFEELKTETLNEFLRITGEFNRRQSDIAGDYQEVVGIIEKSKEDKAIQDRLAENQAKFKDKELMKEANMPEETAEGVKPEEVQAEAAPEPTPGPTPEA